MLLTRTRLAPTDLNLTFVKSASTSGLKYIGPWISYLRFKESQCQVSLVEG